MGKVIRYISQEDLDNAERLRKIWNQAKKDRGVTQKDAVKAFGWSQPTVSQYLNGDIALNTDAIMKWAKFLGCKPEAISPKLGKTITTVSRTKVYVMGSISRKPSAKDFLEIKRSKNLNEGEYALEIDSDFGDELPNGSFCICSPSRLLKRNEKAMLQTKKGYTPVLLLEVGDHIEFTEIGSDEIQSLPQRMVITLHKIVGYEFP